MPKHHAIPLAPYAVSSDAAAMRVHKDTSALCGDPFEIDRHRILNCTAMRRLEGKTQVFAPRYHDHFRTRLTHTLEVAHIARLLAVRLCVNERLCEAIALAHDLGHPPFGHAGEQALSELMADHGGFNHNTHALRVVDYLEHPFPQFRGLNLTHETRAGLMEHATPYDTPECHDPRRPDAHRDEGARDCSGVTVEAQIVSLADRIAYNLHDLEDAIGAELVRADDLLRVQLWQSALDQLELAKGVISIHAIRRSVLDTMLSDLLTDIETTSGVLLKPIQSIEDVRRANSPLVELSQTKLKPLEELESFLRKAVYLKQAVAQTDAEGQAKIRALFQTYIADPKKLPERFARRLDDQNPHRVVCDYIAGMTDDYCQKQHMLLVNSG